MGLMRREVVYVVICALTVLASPAPDMTTEGEDKFVLSTASWSNSRKSPPLIYKVPSNVRVDDSYFVHMKEGTDVKRIEALVEELRELNDDPTMAEFSARVHGILSRVAVGFSAQLSKQALEKVLSFDEVSHVQEDQYLHTGSLPPSTRPTLSWGLDRLDQSPFSILNRLFQQPCNLTGTGVDVYVVDTGILYSHTEFGGRASYSGCDLVQPFNGGRDCVGHGTHVAGIIGGSGNGVAPGVEMFSVRVINCSGAGSTVSVVHGLECILNRTQHRRRPAVVNMSLYTLRNRMIKRTVETLLKHGITVVTIAGNTFDKPRDSCKFTPASVHGVITVASSTQSNQAQEYTNAGGCVDIYAPGDSILTASSSCQLCMDQAGGTSMAAPFVTGAVALLLEKCPELPPWKVKHHVMSQMAVADVLDLSVIPTRLRSRTPNLLLQITSQMCSIQC